MHKESLKLAWQVIKKNRLIWILGFLSLAFLNGSEFNLVYKFYQINNALADSIGQMSLLGGEYFTEAVWFNWSSLITILILIILALIPLFAQSSLIGGINKIEDQKINFKIALKEGKSIFGRFVAINLVSNSIVYILSLLILVVSRIIFSESTTQILALILGVSAIVVPFAIIVSFITRYAIFYLSQNKQKTIFECYSFGMHLFFKNWFESFKTIVIAFIVLILAFLIASALMSLVVTPTVFLIGLFKISSVLTAEIIGIAILFYLLAIFILMTSMFGVFYYTYWLSIFEKLKKS
ncbi:MAG: hypothetical protein WCX88_01935 [Patescibacteria group bacterium]